VPPAIRVSTSDWMPGSLRVAIQLVLLLGTVMMMAPEIRLIREGSDGRL